MDKIAFGSINFKCVILFIENTYFNPLSIYDSAFSASNSALFEHERNFK